MKTLYLATAATLALLAGQADAASILDLKRIDLAHQSGSAANTLSSAELQSLRALVDTTSGTTSKVDILPNAFAGTLQNWTASLYTGTLNVAVDDDYSFTLNLLKKVSGGYLKIDGTTIELSAFNLNGTNSGNAGAWLSKGAHTFEAFFVKKGGDAEGAFTGKASGQNAGSLLFSPAAAVPEPASWALMMVGFALVGGAARYRRRSLSVTYA